ncbi:MAG: DUF4375 domain-containing protein [Imperialibacter sp.]
MRALFYTGALLLTLTFCSKEDKMRINHWNEFQKENHLKPELNKAEFDSLRAWDFGWFLSEPINIIQDQEEDELRVTKRFSPGQKTLHFFWYLDAEVTNGGFIQFYLNGYGKYIPAIVDGLTLIGDDEMVMLVKQADDLYLKNKVRFDEQTEKIAEEGWGNLYDELKGFDELDDQYYKSHERTMSLLEAYARKNPDDFGILK